MDSLNTKTVHCSKIVSVIRSAEAWIFIENVVKIENTHKPPV